MKIGVMPKQLDNGYFQASQKGVQEAGAALNVFADWQGPTTGTDPDFNAKQIAVVQGWVTAQYSAIALSVDDGAAIAPALKAARTAGVKVVTWDADTTDKTARDFFVTQPVPDVIGAKMIDIIHDAVGANGKYLIISAAANAANQNAWIASMRAYQQATYPGMTELTDPSSSGNPYPTLFTPELT